MMKARKHHLRKTRNQTSKRLDYILLGVIIAVAAVLRLWKLGQVPFMHDEFSALIRTDYDNLRDLVVNGIIADTHPAGVQFFLFLWAKLVGWSEFWIKLPFALMGIASIYLVFKVGKQWFNNKVGLLAAAFFAVSQFTVFYSQLARPYIAGMFAVLLFAVFWNKFLFDLKKPSLGTCIGFAIAAALAALAHSFSTAQAGLMFLTGLFFLPKERRKSYWLSGVGALVLYSPNLPIFYHQLIEEGGIGGWLAMPKSTFLIDFVQYTMNYAPLFLFAAGIIMLLPILLQNRQKRRYPIRWAALAWFLIAFGVAYTYSLLREPILQQSTLIFSYPFLIIVCFSLFKNNTLTQLQTIAVVAVMLFAGATSLITTRAHYDLMYHQGFDQIAAKMQEDNEKYGDKIQFATRSEIGLASEFYQEQTEVTDRIVFDRYAPLKDFNTWLDAHQKEMLGFGWTDYVNPIWEATAIGNYPNQISSKYWFTSRYMTLSKNASDSSIYLLNDQLTEPYTFAEGQEWGQSVRFTLDSIESKAEVLGVTAAFHCHDTLQHAVMVIEVRDAATDTLVYWHGSNGSDGYFLPGTHVVADALVFNDELRPEGKIFKAYLWNKDKKQLTLNKISYYTREKNPILTGLYEPLN